MREVSETLTSLRRHRPCALRTARLCSWKTSEHAGVRRNLFRKLNQPLCPYTFQIANRSLQMEFLLGYRYICAMPKLLGPFVSVLLCAAPATAICQLPDLPPAPAQTAPAAAKPAFALPSPSYDRPTGPVPDPKKDWFCDAPPTTVFTDVTKAHPEKEGAVESYGNLITAKLYDTWIRSLPRSAMNSWASGRLVKVRFAIMPDGSFSSPEVTVSSGKSDYDRAAINAILLRGIFPPPPQGPWKSLPVCIRFFSHIHPPDTSQDWIKDAK